mmetsp:Transcript_132923/g.230995  ORF Transcript_132923/g.230995 Transcript_132923/m.230995 type:complete len:208 (+) Transcript_132923:542-1165(+)
MSNQIGSKKPGIVHLLQHGDTARAAATASCPRSVHELGIYPGAGLVAAPKAQLCAVKCLLVIPNRKIIVCDPLLTCIALATISPVAHTKEPADDEWNDKCQWSSSDLSPLLLGIHEEHHPDRKANSHDACACCSSGTHGILLKAQEAQTTKHQSKDADASDPEMCAGDMRGIVRTKWCGVGARITRQSQPSAELQSDQLCSRRESGI